MEEPSVDAQWRIRAVPGSAWLCATKGLFVWAELCVVLAGFGLAGLPFALVAAACVLSFVYLGWRGFCSQVSFDGVRLVRIRNGLRSYTVPTSSIMGSAVVSRSKMPPRLALKVEGDGRTRLIALDGTARMTRNGRAQVVSDLRSQSLIRPAVLRAFEEFQW